MRFYSTLVTLLNLLFETSSCVESLQTVVPLRRAEGLWHNRRAMGEMNRLYYGDNLDVLRRYVAAESVDLVYLDPPFNSDATYNVLFKEHNGTEAAAQIKAFEDTWHWDQNAARAYQETVEAGGKVSEALQAFRKLVASRTCWRISR